MKLCFLVSENWKDKTAQRKRWLSLWLFNNQKFKSLLGKRSLNFLQGEDYLEKENSK